MILCNINGPVSRLFSILSVEGSEYYKIGLGELGKDLERRFVTRLRNLIVSGAQ